MSAGQAEIENGWMQDGLTRWITFFSYTMNLTLTLPRESYVSVLRLHCECGHRCPHTDPCTWSNRPQLVLSSNMAQCIVYYFITPSALSVNDPTIINRRWFKLCYQLRFTLFVCLFTKCAGDIWDLFSCFGSPQCCMVRMWNSSAYANCSLSTIFLACVSVCWFVSTACNSALSRSSVAWWILCPEKWKFLSWGTAHLHLPWRT